MCQHETMTPSLYEKYQIPSGQFIDPLSTLRFILRKAELGKFLSKSEKQWLVQQNLSAAIELIEMQEVYRNSLEQEVRSELRELRQNPFIPKSFLLTTIPSIESDQALLFYKINNLEELSEEDGRLVGAEYKKCSDIHRAKTKHGIVENTPDDEAFLRLLNKLDSSTFLSAIDLEWLYEQRIFSILAVFSDHISSLCDKYETDASQLSVSDKFRLYLAMQKLEERKSLNDDEHQFMNHRGFLYALAIEFDLLKEKFGAIEFVDSNPSQHLYKVLRKMESRQAVTDPDANYLRKRKLLSTLKLALQPAADLLTQKIQQGHGLGSEDIEWCRKNGFPELIITSLKKSHGLEHRDDKPESRLYPILEKMERSERLSDDDQVWLEAENWCHQYSKGESRIFLFHHSREASFYEAEFRRTKNFRNLVEASSHWRKAKQAEKALEQTSDLAMIRGLKDQNLKAALLTTRGGALRDLGQLGDSEKFALEAKAVNPNKHYPYTLLGALCYDTRRYDEGDTWFEEAVKRGAKAKDQDAEIKRILKRKGKDRQEMVEHLLAKDPQRFAWVK